MMNTPTFDSFIEKIENQLKTEGVVGAIRRTGQSHDHAQTLEALTRVGRMLNPAFVIDDDNRFFFQNIVRWINEDAQLMQNVEADKLLEASAGDDGLTRGFYLAGKTGVGKSLALEAVFYLCRALDLQIVLKNKPYRFAPSFVTNAKKINLEYERDGAQVILEYSEKPILGIQDLGSESFESKHMGNPHNILREILEQRADGRGLVTFITSNYRINSDRLKEFYGDRVADRLRQMCNYYILKGESRRK